MTRSRKRRRRQNSIKASFAKHSPTVLLILAFLLALASIVKFVLPQLREVEASSELVANCLDDSDIRSHTVVLIDVTDTYSTEQRRNASFIIREAQRRIPLGGKLSIYLLNENAFRPEELLSACRPKNEDDINPIAESSYGQSFAWLDFINSAQTQFDKALTASDSSRSPIIEAITVVRDRHDFSQRVGERRIIIVSDMLQFSDSVSLYDRNFLAAVSSDVAKAPINTIDLRGIDIEVSTMRRPNSEQQAHPGLSAFWDQFFSKSRANSWVCSQTTEVCIF